MKFTLFVLLFAASLAAQNEDTAEAHVKAGEEQWAKSHIVEAEAEFLKANRLDGKDPRPWWGLARVAQLSSFHRTAGTYLSRAHTLAPKSPDLELAYAHTLDPIAERVSLEDFLAAPPAGEERTLKRLRARLDFLRLVGDRESALLSSYEATSIQLAPLLNGIHHQRGWGLMVQVNGAKPVLLVLDTGASGILLNPRAAAKAGLERVADTSFTGLGDNGMQTGFLARAKRVKVGTVEFENVGVEVSDRRTMDETDGLIGTDVFERFLVTLDFRLHVLQLAPLPQREGRLTDRVVNSPDRKGWVPVYRLNHMLLIRTRVSDSAPVLFLLDTGAEHSLIDREFAQDLTKVQTDNYRRLRGVSGKVKETYTADQLFLQFAGFKQKNLDMLTLDLGSLRHAGGLEVDGIMGISLLNLFTFSIDYRDGYVKFDYEP